MDHYISLTVKADEYSDELPKVWFKAASETLPEGLPCTIQNGENNARMKLTRKDGKAILSIPLVRNLTKKEVEAVIEEFTSVFDGDFSITSTRIEIGVKNEVEVEIDHDPLISLCTAWAKQQHEDWMKDKTEAGWRYGPTVSMSNKTHPLMRPWSDLPDAYRVVDTSKAEQLLKLFNEHGYVMIAKEELDQLLDED